MKQFRVTQSKQIAGILLLAASFLSIFPNAPFFNGLTGALFAFLAFFMIDDAKEEGGEVETPAAEGDGEKKKTGKKQPWENTVYISVFVFRAFLYGPLLRWLLKDGATWADCAVAAAALMVFLELCFLVVYQIKLKPSKQWENMTRFGYFLAPVILGAAAVVPRYYFFVLPAALPGNLYALVLQYMFTAILLLPLLWCFRRGERSGTAKLGAALMITALLVSAAALLAVHTGAAGLPTEYILLVSGAVNVLVMIIWKRSLHDNKEKNEFIGRLGLHTFMPIAACFIVGKWARTMNGVEIFLCVFGAAAVYMIALYIIGNDELKAERKVQREKDALEAKKREAIQRATRTTVSMGKSCGRCGKSVPGDMRAGMRCPHCGVVWGSERQVYRN